MANGNFSASNYRANKAKRAAAIEPEWVTNPETQEKFQLRRVGAMATMLAGYMPHILTNAAVEAWKAKGVESPQAEGRPQVDEAENELQMMAKVIHAACITPKIVLSPQADDEIRLDDLDDSDAIFIFRWATGQINSAGVPMVGGQVMPAGSLQTFPKQRGRRTRTGTHG